MGSPVDRCLAVHLRFVYCRSSSIPSPCCVCQRKFIGMSGKDSLSCFACRVLCALVQELLPREHPPSISTVLHGLVQQFKGNNCASISPISPVLLWLLAMSIFMHIPLLIKIAVCMCIRGLHRHVIHGCCEHQHHFHRLLPTSHCSECASGSAQLNQLLQGRRAAAGSWPRTQLRAMAVGCVRWWMRAKLMSCNTGMR